MLQLALTNKSVFVNLDDWMSSWLNLSLCTIIICQWFHRRRRDDFDCSIAHIPYVYAGSRGASVHRRANSKDCFRISTCARSRSFRGTLCPSICAIDETRADFVAAFVSTWKVLSSSQISRRECSAFGFRLLACMYMYIVRQYKGEREKRLIRARFKRSSALQTHFS